MTALTNRTIKTLEVATTSKQAATELKNLATLATASGVTVATAVQGTAGVKLASGSVTLDGSNPTPITTGLTTVTGFAVMSVRSTTPALDPVAYTYTASAGAVSLYAWKHTSSGDPTLTASGDSDDVITWIAVGT